ncbi:MAG: ASKHA domain-containing protein [Andreesenia angusta]|nr:ASKHA domain-containing protein [Andreesenia angusta]
MGMYKIYINNLDLTIEGKSGKMLCDIITENDLPLEMPCGGRGICGGCAINIRPLGNKYGYKSVIPCRYLLEKDIEIEYLNMNKEDLKSIEINSDKNNIEITEVSIAVDIGTTVVTMKFLNSDNDEIIGTKSFLNPQTAYGNDLISRIDYISDCEIRLRYLKDILIDEIKLEIKNFIKKTKIKNIVFSANTTMLHILAGENPYPLSIHPYKPVFLESRKMSAKDLFGDRKKKYDIYFLPSASAYIGSDIVSGIYSTNFYNSNTPSLFIDIGTNGEIVMNIDGNLKAVSTSAGPALEGMNIDCGSRAIEGAIERFHIDTDKSFKIESINSSDPKSICGSGIIDIIAEFLRNGIIEASGRFNKNMDEVFLKNLKDKKFYITDEIYISQKDIRQVQLAKGAIAAGIKILLNEYGKNINSIENIIIAGSFGYHINKDNMVFIGLIPKEYTGEIEVVGNSSVNGAIEACKDPDIINQMDEIAKKIDVLELSLRDDFQDYFVREMSF